MGWAAHDPELYMKLQVDGVLAKLGFHRDTEPDAAQVMDIIAYHDDDSVQIAWRVLTDWAHREIEIAEGDHFGGLVDDAKERMTDAQEDKDPDANRS